MKNILPALIVVLLFACKKENGTEQRPTTPQTQFPVRFDIGGFNIGFEDLRKAGNESAGKDSSISNYIGFISYSVYLYSPGGDEHLVKRIFQNASNPNFGVITDSLPSGQYTIAVVGSKDSVRLIPHPTFPNIDLLLLDLPGTDVFYKRLVLTVSGNVNESLSLARIVSKLKVVIKDAIPAEADKISFLPKVYPIIWDLPEELNSSFIINNGTVALGRSSYTYNSLVTPALQGTTNLTKEMYVLTPDSGRISFQLQATNAAGTAISTRLIQNIPVNNHQVTVLSGQLFDTPPPANGGVNVGLENPDLSKDSLVVDFH
jgi:hypothetical protein